MPPSVDLAGKAERGIFGAANFLAQRLACRRAVMQRDIAKSLNRDYD
jgi:hypothetical protein